MPGLALPPRNLFRDFKVPMDKTGREMTIKITEPNIRSKGLTLETWGASHVMASVLHLLEDMRFPAGSQEISQSSAEIPIPVLELGAGTGLVGVTASILWKVAVVLTDLDEIVPGLAANIEINADLLAKSKTRGYSGTLDWAHPDSLCFSTPTSPEHAMTVPAERKAQVILAADCIYSDEHPPLLSGAILRWLSKTSDARLILCYPLRVCYIDELNELWRLLEEGGLVALREGKETADALEFADELLCEWSVWKWKDL